MDIAIIGTGNMASGIGTRIIGGKHSVTFYHTKLKKAEDLAEKLGKNAKGEKLGNIINEEIAVLALPYMAIFEVMEKYRSLWNGKILIEISNPLDFQTFQLLPPPGTSGAEEIAKIIPQNAKLIKAFNTTFSKTLEKGEVDGKMLDVFMASDSEESKNILIELIESSGMRALDAGPLSEARALEALGRLHATMQSKLGNTWLTALKILP